jgi:hypothetical protein
MAKYYGNLNDTISTTELVNSLGAGQFELCYLYDEHGEVKSEFLDGVQRENVLNWKRAGYPDPICNGVIHCPYFDFDAKFLYAINKRLGIVSDRCAISVTKPGQVIAPHTDVDGREEELRKFGELKGFHIHLSAPVPGHVFMIEGESYYMQEDGAIYAWDEWDSPHSGANAGLETRYIIAIRGIKPYEPFDYEYVWNEHNPEYLQFKLKDGRVIP